MTGTATPQGRDTAAPEYDATDEEKKAALEARNKANEERLSGVSEIASRHREHRNAEMEAAGHEVQETDELEDEDKPASKQAEKQETEEKPEPTPAAAAQDDDFDELVVDGQTQRVERSKIYDAGKRTLQKESAADKRLAEAADLKRQAEELMAKAQTNQPPTTDAGQSPLSEPSDVNLEAVAEALIDGDKEAVVEALRGLNSGQKGQQFNPNDVMAMVNDTLAINRAMELFQKPTEEGGYGDLYENKRLRNMVLDEESRLFDAEKSAGKFTSPEQRMKQAATEIRKFTAELTGQPVTQSTEQDFNQLQQKKAQATQTPAAATGRPASGEGATPPQTQEQKHRARIQQLQASRGSNID